MTKTKSKCAVKTNTTSQPVTPIASDCVKSPGVAKATASEHSPCDNPSLLPAPHSLPRKKNLDLFFWDFATAKHDNRVNIEYCQKQRCIDDGW